MNNNPKCLHLRVFAFSACIAVGFLILTACGEKESDEYKVHETDAEDAFRAWRQAYNNQDLEALRELVTDPHKMNGVERSIDEYIDFSAKPTWKAFPDLTYNDVKVVATGDYVTTHVHIEGIGSGEFMGQDVEGKSIDITQTLLLRVKDGKIDQFWFDVDMLTAWIQLGVLEHPSAQSE